MDINTDDEIYRVDAVWLGPPGATFPWRVTYAGYLHGGGILCAVLTAQHRLGLALGPFTIGWALVITVLVTRYLSRLVNYERPLSHVLGALYSEIRTPRWRDTPVGGAFAHRAVRHRDHRPVPPSRHRRPRGGHR